MKYCNILIIVCIIILVVLIFLKKENFLERFEANENENNIGTFINKIIKPATDIFRQITVVQPEEINENSDENEDITNDNKTPLPYHNFGDSSKYNLFNEVDNEYYPHTHKISRKNFNKLFKAYQKFLEQKGEETITTDSPEFNNLITIVNTNTEENFTTSKTEEIIKQNIEKIENFPELMNPNKKIVLFSGSDNRNVDVWDLTQNSNNILKSISKMGNELVTSYVTDMKIANINNTKYLFTTYKDDYNINMWNLNTLQFEKSFKVDMEEINNISKIFIYGKYLFGIPRYTSKKSDILLWDIIENKKINRSFMKNQDYYIWDIFVYEKNKNVFLFISCNKKNSNNNEIKIWKLNDKNYFKNKDLLQNNYSNKYNKNSIYVYDDYLFTGDGSGKIKMLDIRCWIYPQVASGLNNKVIPTFNHDNDAIIKLIVYKIKNKKYLFTLTYKSIKMWDIYSSENLHEFVNTTNIDNRYSDMNIYQDKNNNYYLAATSSNNIKIWNISNVCASNECNYIRYINTGNSNNNKVILNEIDYINL